MDHHLVAVGPLSLYADVEGRGPSLPLLLLHGGMCTIEASFAALRPLWSTHRTTIAVEQQAHGRTADIDRPLDFEQMADDTEVLLRSLGHPRVDIVGYSDGGNVALALAMRHPGRVGRIALYGTNANNDGLSPRIRQVLLEGARKPPEQAAAGMPRQLREAYEAVAPRPEDWPRLVHKVMQQSADFRGWPAEALQRVSAPVLTMVGDTDAVTVEHAQWMAAQFGGPLAVLPRSDHSAVFTRADWIADMVDDFLDTKAQDLKRH